MKITYNNYYNSMINKKIKLDIHKKGLADSNLSFKKRMMTCNLNNNKLIYNCKSNRILRID